MPRANKFHARKVTADGYTFDSIAEHRRYCELALLARAREISDLEVHRKYDLTVSGEKVGVYTADFTYVAKDGSVVVEDTKSKATMTSEASLRIRLFQALYRCQVSLVGNGVPKVRKFKTRAA